ncbi:MAG: DUF2235 domain-containing protein [Rhodocyclaceae bacterium]|nr:DUF2235 domain-containing protein [Rhodocyclaceae bacterium]
MKNIVICCDGTWNTPDEQDNGVPTPTNVVRLHHALAVADKSGTGQHRYYHPGVGTGKSWWDKVIGGGTGKGLEANIKSAYRELCDHYVPGDAIYMFGFSRGAYTVRSLCGFIAACGLLKSAALPDGAQLWAAIDRLFMNGYRRKAETRQEWDRDGLPFHTPAAAPVPIRFLGVWDTVGALGIPDDLALLNLIDNLHDFTFHDTGLGDSIQSARHAVALDEMRATFQPTLWNAAAERDAKELWFPGAHSDVGGGYAETGLSDGALLWMLREAESCGLAFDPDVVAQIRPDPLGVLHDSARGVFEALPTQPRGAPRLGVSPAMHESVLRRQKTPPIQQGSYRAEVDLPEGSALALDIFAAQPWNATGLWLEAGRSYTFSASGEWMDSSIRSGPGGTNDGNFQPGELAHLVGTAWGKVENLWKKVTGNEAADFKFTRRHESMPWFCLVGAIANGSGVDAKGHTLAHEAFAIGAGCTYKPLRSGYFYAYANDAWGFYGNNRGRVRLNISA